VSDSSGSGISSAEADATYAKLAGGQTIVGEETFAGGILTNIITPSSGSQVSVDTDLLYATGSIGTPFSVTAAGDVEGATLTATASSSLADASCTSLSCTGTASLQNTTVTGNITQTGNLTISGNITQNSGYSTSLRTTTINGSCTVTRVIQSGTTSENSFAGNCSFSKNVFLGSSTILASSWTASTLSGSTYSYTISLSSITSGDFAGQIYISVKNTTTASLLSQLNYFAVKANGVLTLTSTSSAPNNFGTYTLNSVTTNKLTVASSNTDITVSTYTTSSSVCWYFVGAIV
jgi:hypothetical protein